MRARALALDASREALLIFGANERARRARQASRLSDLDAGLVQRALEELRAGTGADRHRVGVGGRADVGGLREGLPVHHHLDRRGGLDALDGVPLAVVDR